jgi:small subunit ribosomal protein S9
MTTNREDRKRLVSQSKQHSTRPKLYPGSRKTSRATAALHQGQGRIRVNGIPLEIWQPEIARLHMLTPVQLVGELREKYDVDVRVAGGGFMSQADAVAMSLARAYVDQVKSTDLRDKINACNKYLLSGDPRQAEPKKFGGPGARRKRQKSYR